MKKTDINDMNRLKALMMQHVPMMVTCRDANEFLDDYLSDELPLKQRLIFEWHIRLCSGCKDYLDRYRRSIDLCRDNFYDSEEEADEEVPEQIMKGIIAAKQATREE